MHTMMIALGAVLTGALLGFVLAKRASSWCPACGGPSAPGQADDRAAHPHPAPSRKGP